MVGALGQVSNGVEQGTVEVEEYIILCYGVCLSYPNDTIISPCGAVFNDTSVKNRFSGLKKESEYVKISVLRNQTEQLC